MKTNIKLIKNKRTENEQKIDDLWRQILEIKYNELLEKNPVDKDFKYLCMKSSMIREQIDNMF